MRSHASGAASFDDLAPRYAGNWTDAPTVIVRVTSAQGTKTVSDYSTVGPIRLWAVQQAIDALIDKGIWK